MDRFRLLFVIALRNLRSHRVKTLIVAGIVAFGSFLLVSGLAALRSMEGAMQRSITASLTGHVQVWSDATDDEFRMINLGADQPDIKALENFSEVEAKLTQLDGISAVVPMATGIASTFARSDLDVALERLRKAAESGDGPRFEASRQQVRLIARLLVDEFANRIAISATPDAWKEKLEVARRVDSDAFWASYEEDPTAATEFLDTTFAPLAPEGRSLYPGYIATDPAQFAQVFQKFRIVDGEMIPPGQRGLLFSKRFYERAVKNSIAREFDRLEEKLGEGARIADDPTLQGRARRLGRQSTALVLQLDPEGAEALRPKLQQILGSDETRLLELVREFLQVDDANFHARHKFFYDEIAPRTRLYAFEPGDVVVLQAFTDNGYFKSVAVRLFGTFEFEGLESSNVAGMYNLTDLVTFRQLYGKMSADQKAELQQIRDAVGVDAIDRDAAEDALFGSVDAELESEGESVPIDDEIARDDRAEVQDVDEAVTREQIREGLVLNVAVILDDPDRISEVVAAIDAIPGLQATDWRAASGIVGQFALVVSGVLWVAILIIFLVALAIINNTMLMAMLERTSEIGTLRAIGGQRAEVLSMVLIETAITTLGAWITGTGIAIGVVTWLGSVGIPAPSTYIVLLFGGERLYPSVSLEEVVISFVIVSAVTLLSAFYPALTAVRVQPVVAMRED